MSSKSRAIGDGKDGKPALVPQLRFPEFRDQALLQVELRDVTAESTLRNGKRLPASVVMGVSKANGIVPMDDRIVASDIGRYKVVRKDWFAYNPMRLNIGSIARWQGDTDILVSPDYIVFRCLNEQEPGLQPAFLDQFRQSAAWENFVTQGGGGSVRIRIYYDDIGILKLILPALAEQQKIAECLSSLDEALAVQASKVEALKKHKRGLMQQLLPREGETQPRLRFPEFQKASEWKSRTLGSVCSSFSGGTPSTSKPEYYGGDIPFIRSAEIARDKTDLFLTRKGLEHSAAKLVAKGDVLIALYGANSGDVALATIGGAINQAILCLKSKESNSFICQFLSFKKDWIVATYLQGGQGNLSGEIIKSIVVSFPAPEEQKRIAACLSSLDALITTEAEKLETLKTHKRGLMQQLFPSRAEDNA